MNLHVSPTRCHICNNLMGFIFTGPCSAFQPDKNLQTLNVTNTNKNISNHVISKKISISFQGCNLSKRVKT